MEDIDSDIKICGACDYFGFYKEMEFGEWEKDPENPDRYVRKFLGFKKHRGADCRHEKRKNVRIYDNSRACQYFKERTWERAESCKDCDLKHGGDEKHVFCTGYPFTNKTGYSPCDNGRTEIGKQLSLL